MTVTDPIESLPARLIRQERERQELLGPAQDELDRKLKAAEDAEVAAAKADNEPDRLTARKRKTQLQQQRADLLDAIEAKGLAIAATTREIAAGKRAARIAEFVAYAATVADLVPEVRNDLAALLDSAGRLSGQLQAAYTVGTQLDRGGPELNHLTAARLLNGELEALAARGVPWVEQAAELLAMARRVK